MKRIVAILFLVACVAGASERKAPPTKEELAGITQRGRALYEYDEVAWHGTDAVLATNPDKSKLGRFIALRADDGWHLGFGKLNADGSKFLLAYEAIQTKGGKYKVVSLDPVKEEEGFYASAARAVEVTAKVLKVAEVRQYNYAILPAPEGKLFVYWLPAQREDDVYPLGGDTRYVVSGDGRTILETRRMHNGIIELRPEQLPKGATSAGGVHTAILDDVPEDSDVFHVLTRRPSVPEFVATQKYSYSIGVDGTIKFEGKTKKR